MRSAVLKCTDPTVLYSREQDIEKHMRVRGSSPPHFVLSSVSLLRAWRNLAQAESGLQNSLWVQDLQDLMQL